jgi:cell wall-associated NlpC family hydrolase
MTEKKILDKYLGVPYKHQGRSIEGTDCYGLIVMLFNELGIRIIDLERYDEDWSWKGKALDLEENYKSWNKVAKPIMYDVVLFRNGKGVVNHAGVMLDNNRFIHTSKGAGTVVGRVSEFIKKDRLAGYYRNRYLL